MGRQAEPAARDHHPFRVGDWVVDPSRNQVARDGETVHLRPRVMDLLRCLAAHPGEVVPKQRILDEVWGTEFVAESALTTALTELRHALADGAADGGFVETVPKRGYRLVAPVAAIDPAARPAGDARPATADADGERAPALPAEARWNIVARAAAALLATAAIAGLAAWRPWVRPPHVTSVAVLPLDDLSHGADYFADGVTEGLITEISRLAELEKVINRRSAMQYKRSAKANAEIARELGVEALLVGTVFRSPTHVRIAAQLVDARDDRVIWAGSFERPAADVLVLQQALVRDIVTAVGLTLRPAAVSSAAPRVDPDAYDLYLRGLEAFDDYSAANMARAAALFRQSIALDPRFANARASLAIALAHESMITGSDLPAGAAREAARAALGLDPAAGEAHSADGVLLDFAWRWADAEAAHRQAVAFAPHSSLVRMGFAHHLGMLGRYEESMAQARRAMDLDPTSGAASGELFWASVHARRFEQCVAMLRVSADPSSPEAEDPLARAARWFLDMCEARLGRVASVCARGPDRPFCGYAHLVAGNLDEARRVRRVSCPDLSDELAPGTGATMGGPFAHHQSFCFQLAAALGDREPMLRWAEHLVRVHHPLCAFFRGPDTYDLLKDEPRYQAVLRQIGLPE